MQIFFHVPGDVFGGYFFDVLQVEKVERKYLLGRLGVFVFGLKLLKKAFVGIDFIEVFMILERGFSDSEDFTPERADTWVINGFSLSVITVPEIFQINKLYILEFLIDLIFIFVLLLFPYDVVDAILVFNISVNESKSGVYLIHLGVSILCYDFLVLYTTVVGRQNLCLNLKRFHVLPINTVFTCLFSTLRLIFDINVVKTQRKAFYQLNFLDCFLTKLNTFVCVCFNHFLRFFVTFCLFTFLCEFRLFRDVRVLIEDSQNQVLITEVDGFADMSNQFIHLVIDWGKRCSDHFSVMSYKVRELKLGIIGLFKGVDLGSAGQALVDLFFGNVF